MKRLVMTQLARTAPLSGGRGVQVVLDTSEGPLEVRLTREDAQRLAAALHKHLPPKAKAVARWETGIDPVNQDAVILAHYADDTRHETRIPRNEVPAIAEFLDQARRRFDASADMRQ